jgi:trimeric autotransporter adhesin
MRRGKIAARFFLLMAAGGLLFPMQALSLPNDPTVVAGQSEITQSGTQMTVTQTTDRSIINWGGYSIDTNELVQYLQPGVNSVSLNRITGGNPSEILGQLLANGQIFLINPSGIVFGKDATINVAGLLATTLNIADTDFLSGRYNFAQDDSAALSYVINKGTIIVQDNGYAVLVAPLVSNEGLIVANMGRVALGGAESFSVSFDGQGLVNFAISAPVAGEPGTVLIPSGQVSDIIKEVVGTPALVEAGSVVEEGGMTYLGSASGTVINSGTIRADGTAGQNAGSIIIDSNLVSAIVPGAVLSASGVGENSSGGEIKILSEGNVAFTPGVTAEAKGGISGDGGLVEASAGGHIYLGADVNTLAENGETGVYIIDPTTLYVDDGSRGGGDTFTGGTYGGFLDTPATDTVYETELENASTDIVLQATQNITVNDITDGTINIATAGIDLDMQAIGTGAITFADTTDTIQTNGGYINISNPSGSVTLGNLTTAGGAVTVLSTASSVGNIDTSSTTGVGGAVNITWSGASGTGTIASIDSSSSNAGSAGGDINVIASNIDVTVAGTINSSPGAGGTAGNVQIVANQLALGDAVTTGGGSLTLALGGTTNSFDQITTSGGAVSITGGENYTFADALNSGGGQIVIDSSDGTVAINADITSGGGATTITGGESVVMDTGTTINSGAGLLTITADTGVVTLYALTTNAKDITVTSNGGTVSLNDNIATSGGKFTVTGGDTITQATGTTINTGAGDITLTADNNITIASATTSGTAVATSDYGSITDDGDGTTDLTAGTVVLTAGDGTLTSGADIDIDTSSVDITATADNGITLNNNSAADATVNATSRVEGDIEVNQTGAGKLFITAQTTDGNIVATGATSNIRADNVIAGGDGDVYLYSSTAINVAYVEALGNMVEIESGGHVREAPGAEAAADIVAQDLVVSAVTDIGWTSWGDPNNLEIDVDNLAVSAGDDVMLNNTGALTVKDLTGWHNLGTIPGVTTAGGEVHIETASPIILDSDTDAGAAPITYVANGSDGYIEVNATVQNSGGGNNITLTANGVNGSGYSVIMDSASGVMIDAGGDVYIIANSATSGDIRLSQVTSGDDIYVTAVNTTGGGSILDDGVDTTALKAFDDLSLLADVDIGANTGASVIPEGYLDIDMTNTPSLNVVATNGDIWLNFINSGGMTSTSLSGALAAGGSVNLGVTGNNFTFDDGTFDGVGFDLSVIAANIYLDYDGGNDIDTFGNVALTATVGDIQDTSGTDNNVDIIANSLEMYAAGSIEGDTLAGNPDEYIETSVSDGTDTTDILAVADNDIFLKNNSATDAYVDVESLLTGDIEIFQSGAGRLLLTAETASGNIIGSSAASNTIAQSVIAGGTGDVYLYALNQIDVWYIEADGDMVELEAATNNVREPNGISSDTAIDILAQDLIISAGGDVGYYDWLDDRNIETQVSNLAVSSVGGVMLNNTGALNIKSLSGWKNLGAISGVTASGGPVHIETASPMTVSADVTASGDINLVAGDGGTADSGDLNVDADVISSGGDVYLTADHDINLTLTSGTLNQVDAGGATPTITLTADNNGNNTGAVSQSGGTIGSGDDFVDVSAAEGIALGDATVAVAPELGVTSIQATNTTSGDIDIYNTGTFSVTGTGVTNSADGGEIYLQSFGGDININANVTTEYSDIDIYANDNINQATGTTIYANNSGAPVGGAILLQADSDSDNIGGITQTGTAGIVTDDNMIGLYAGPAPNTVGGNIALTYVNAGSSGLVFIVTGGGAVIDNDVVDDLDIIASQLGIDAVTGIGTLAKPIDTQVTGADFTNWTTGDIAIINTGDLNLVNWWNTFGWAVANNIVPSGLPVGTVSIEAKSNIEILSPIVTFGTNLILTASENIIQWGTPFGGVIYTGSTNPLWDGGVLGPPFPVHTSDGYTAGSYTATADSDLNGTGEYYMATSTFIDTTDPDGSGSAGSVLINAGDDITVTDIWSDGSSITLNALDPVNFDASIVDDSDDTTYISAAGINLTVDLDIGGTDGLAGIRPEFLDIDTTYLTTGGITLTGSNLGSDFYLNFLNGDFLSSYLASPAGVAPNNSTTSINSLTIGVSEGVSGGNDIILDSDIFQVDDAGGTGIYYDLTLLSTGDLVISNPIITNDDEVTLGTAGDLIITTSNVTFSNLPGTLTLWADFDQDGTGKLISGGRITLNNVENLILIAAEGIIMATQGTYNLAAYNDPRIDPPPVKTEITVDNIGDITIFDGTAWIGDPGVTLVDVNGINNEAGGHVYIYAHSSININAPINTSGGDLDLIATESITHNVLGDIDTDGGNYTGIFNENPLLFGQYTMADDGADWTVIDVTGGAGTGVATIQSPLGAGGNITVSEILADTATGAISLATSGGAIQEAANDTDIYDLVANQVLLYANSGIGSGDALETNMNNFGAVNTDSSDIWIVNMAPGTSGLTIIAAAPGMGVYNSGGDIRIEEGSPINVLNPIFAGGQVTLIANDTPGFDDGDIITSGLGTITGSTIWLYAGHDVDMGADITALGYLQICADDPTASANNNSTGTGDIIYTSGRATAPGMNLVGVNIGSLGSPFYIDADQLNAHAGMGNSTGDIYISEMNDITLFDVDTYDGVIDITSNGSMVAWNVQSAIGSVTPRNIELTSGSDLTAGTVIAGNNGNVTLTAGGAILDTTGDVTGNILTADANGAITLTTDVVSMDVSANAAGNIDIYENDGIILTDVDTTDGDIKVTAAAGSITATDVQAGGSGDIFLTATGGTSNITVGTVTATGDAVTLDAGQNISGAGTVTASQLYLAAGGTATLNTDVDYIDDKSLTENVSGSISISETDSVTLGATNGLSTDSGTISVTSGGAMTATQVTAGGTGDVQLSSGGDILLGTVDAAADMVSLSAGIGFAIIDNNGLSLNVLANDLLATAYTGIGSGDALETQVSNLQAINSTSGNVEIVNTGALTLTNTFYPAAQSVYTPGIINIQALSALNVNNDVWGGGDVTLIAGDNDAVTTDDLTIKADVNVQSAGDILLQAGDDITQAAGTGVITAGGADISLIAGHDNDNTGLINMAGTVGDDSSSLLYITLITSANKGITLADADITYFQATNTHSGDIDITNLGPGSGIYTYGTGIVNLGPGDIYIDSLNCVTIDHHVTASGGNIEISSIDDFQINALISTTGAGTVTLTAVNGGSSNGYIELYNSGGAIHTVDGEITLTADENITMGSATSITSVSGNVELDAQESVDVATIATSVSTGEVRITSANGAVTDTNGANLNVTSKDLIISAGTSIGNADALETQVSRLAARVTTDSGALRIDNIGDLELADLDSWGYSVSNPGTSSSTGYVSITTASDILISSPVISDYLRLVASGAILDGNGTGADIQEVNSGFGRAMLIAGTGIGADVNGATSDFIETDISLFGAESGTGVIKIKETDSLIVTSFLVGPHGSPTTLKTEGDIDIVINTGVLSVGVLTLSIPVESNGGNIDIDTRDTGAGNLVQNDAANILSSGGDITIDTVDLTQDANSKIDAGAGNVDIDATGNVALDEINGTVVDIDAGGYIEEETADVDIDITADDLILAAATGIGSVDDLETDVETLDAENTTSGDINITNTGELEIYGIDNDGDAVTVINDDTIRIDDTVEADGNITLTANGASSDIIAPNGYGDIDAVLSHDGFIDMDAGRDIALGDNTGYADVYTEGLDAVDTVTLTAGRDITVDYFTYVGSDYGDVTLDAGRDIYVITRVLGEVSMIYTEGPGLLTLDADNNVNIIGGEIRTYSTGNIDIDAGNDVYISQDADIDSGGSVDITADNDVDIINNSEIKADGDIDVADGDINVKAEDGYIRICLDSVLDAEDNVSLDAGTDIIICENSQVLADDDATLKADENVYLGYVKAGDTVNVRADDDEDGTGAIFDNNDDLVNIEAPNIVLYAAEGIGADDGLETQTGSGTGTLTAENTDTGDIWIRNNTEVAGDLEILGITNSAPDGLVRVENGYIIFENGALVGGEEDGIKRETGGNMILSGPVEAEDGSVILRTIGSIIDDNTGTPYDVIATGDSEMLAFAGDGVFNPNDNPTIGEFDGIIYDPVEVNINGELYVYAQGENNLVSVAIDGIVEPSDVLRAYDGMIPPGLVFFNGRMEGGMRSPEWFRRVSPSVIMIGNEQTFWTELLLHILDKDWTDLAPAHWEFDEELDNSLDLITRK